MQADPRYADLMGEVKSYLVSGIEKATAAGVREDRILIDPGIGFGKNTEHNLELVARLKELAALGYPVVLGVSRKAFIGRLTGGAPASDRLGRDHCRLGAGHCERREYHQGPRRKGGPPRGGRRGRDTKQNERIEGDGA